MLKFAKKIGRRASQKTKNRFSRAVMEAMEPRTFLSITLTGSPTDNAPIQSTGEFRASGFAQVNNASLGTGAYAFQTYEVLTFGPSSTVQPGTFKLSDITGASLQLFNTATTGNFAAHTGTFDVWLLENSEATTPTTSLTYQATGDGLNGQGGATMLGTFNFSNTSGYTPYTFSGVNSSSGVWQAMLNEMNAGSNVRIAVTAESAGGGEDWSANRTNTGAVVQNPVLSLTADPIAPITEQFNVSSPSYNVDETSGTVEVSVLRTGYTGDAATVHYATSNGTALSGTNYTTTSGTLNFSAGETIKVLSVPITNVAGANGNKNFNVTISAPTAGTATPSIGSSAVSAVTIVDSAPLATNAISGVTSTASDVETGGPFSSSFASVTGNANAGSSSFGFLTYQVFDFTPAGSPGLYPTAGTTVTNVNNLSLELYNTATTGNFGGHVGNFNVYFVPDDETTFPDTSWEYLPETDVTGLAGQGGTSSAASSLLGTFSFNNAAVGTDTYTAATLSTAVATALKTALNAGTPIRLVVTPQTGGTAADGADASKANGMAADWEGTGGPANEKPTLLLNAPETVNQTQEIVSFSSPTYSVNESAGTATINVTRAAGPGGNLNDQETVNVATSDGTALAGTNYAGVNTTLTFLAHQTSQSFTVPIADVVDMDGNKALRLTLSNASTTSFPSTTVGVIGTGSAVLTIDDIANTTANTFNLTQFRSDNSTVEINGPFITSTATSNPYGFFNVGGTDARFASYGVLDFNDPTVSNPNDGTPLVFSPTHTVTAINDIFLDVTQGSPAEGTSGPLDVYLVPDTTTNIDPAIGNGPGGSNQQVRNPLFFDTTKAPEGLGTQLGTPMLLGQVNWDATTAANATEDLQLLDYSPSAETSLIAALNSAGATKFRVVITPETSSVLASWYGEASNAGVYEAPAMSFDVRESITNTPTLPSYITPEPGAVYTYNSGTGALNLTSGTLIFTDDSAGPNGGAEVNLTVSGSGSLAIINSTQHLLGLTLTNQGGVQVNDVGAFRSHDNHDVLVIGTVTQTTNPTFSIASNSKLNLESNDMIVHHGSFTTVNNAAQEGRDPSSGGPGGQLDGQWDGNGLSSSTAANVDANVGFEQNILAVVDNNDLNNTVGQYSSWTVGSFSEPLRSDGNDVIVKYTYNGDFALEGMVAGDAAGIFGLFYDNGASTGNLFAYGDTNGDGKIDGNDAGAFGLLYGLGTGGVNGDQL